MGNEQRFDEIMKLVENKTPEQLMEKSTRLVVLTLELPEACWLGLELAEISTGISQSKFMSDIVAHQIENMNRLAILEILKSKMK